VSWYELLLFVHVACAVIWLGGAFVFQVYGLAVQRGGDSAEMAQFAGRAGHVGERLFTPTALLLLLAGIGLMIEGSWSWGSLWIVFALVTFGASFALGLFVIGPMAKRIPAVGPTTPQGQELIRRLFGLLRVDLVLLFAIVFAMTVKPSGDDVWTLVIAAAVGVALIALFLQRARASAVPTQAAVEQQ
jgi:uncharacterized membrane protein